MKTQQILLVFFVSWQLNFQALGGKMETVVRERQFETKAEAVEFMSHRPFDFKVFECVDSMTGRAGHCAIHDMRMEERP